MTLFTESTRAQDILVTEFDYRYCRLADKVTQAAGAQEARAGTVLKGSAGARQVAATTETATCILLTDIGIIAQGVVHDCVTLVRGPVVVDKQRLTMSDGSAGLEAAEAAMITALSSLNPPMVFIDGPTLIEDSAPPIGGI